MLKADGSEFYLVQYVRETILDRGGMGPAGRPTDADLLKPPTSFRIPAVPN